MQKECEDALLTVDKLATLNGDPQYERTLSKVLKLMQSAKEAGLGQVVALLEVAAEDLEQFHSFSNGCVQKLDREQFMDTGREIDKALDGVPIDLNATIGREIVKKFAKLFTNFVHVAENGHLSGE